MSKCKSIVRVRPVIGSSCVCLIRCVNKVNLYWVHKEMKIVFREIMEIELLMECIANMQKYARIKDTCTLIWSSIFYQENTSSTYNIWKRYLLKILITYIIHSIANILYTTHINFIIIMYRYRWQMGKYYWSLW